LTKEEIELYASLAMKQNSTLSMHARWLKRTWKKYLKILSGKVDIRLYDNRSGIDTHVGGRIKSLPKELLDGLRGVDLIIHAGDILKDFVIYELEEIAPVEAVAGNNDDYYMQHKLGVKKIINAGKFKIGITHDTGSQCVKKGNGDVCERQCGLCGIWTQPRTL